MSVEVVYSWAEYSVGPTASVGRTAWDELNVGPIYIGADAWA